MKYWKTFRRDIIYEYIQSFCDQKTKFTLWQQEGSKRNTYKSQFEKIKNTKVTVKVGDSISLIKFPVQEDAPIYLHVPGAEFIFKKDTP